MIDRLHRFVRAHELSPPAHDPTPEPVECRTAMVMICLYEDMGGHMRVHVKDQPRAYSLAAVAGRDFAADAEALAAGDQPAGWDEVVDEVIDLSQVDQAHWPGRMGRLVATWDDGEVSGLLSSESRAGTGAFEASGRARRYVGPPGRRRDPAGGAAAEGASETG